MRSFLITPALAAFLTFQPAHCMAADLFELSGTKSDGTAVDITITEAIAEEIGATELSTKVVSQGDAISVVRGVEIRKLIEKFDLQGDKLHVTAHDGYAMDIPMEDVKTYPVVFGFAINGKKLRIRDNGPSWVIYPVSDHPELDNADFEARSVWQVKRVEIGSK